MNPKRITAAQRAWGRRKGAARASARRAANYEAVLAALAERLEALLLRAGRLRYELAELDSELARLDDEEQAAG